MKLKLILSACLAVATLAPVAASAQRHDRVERHTVIRHEERHHNWRGHTRRICRWEWRHHHKVRICRTVRR
jgi:hypothetical protein